MTSLDECISHGMIKIIDPNDYYKRQPNCRECDGYGIDAKKYGWKCYAPIRKYLTNRMQRFIENDTEDKNNE